MSGTIRRHDPSPEVGVHRGRSDLVCGGYTSSVGGPAVSGRSSILLKRMDCRPVGPSWYLRHGCGTVVTRLSRVVARVAGRSFPFGTGTGPLICCTKPPRTVRTHSTPHVLSSRPTPDSNGDVLVHTCMYVCRKMAS